MSISNQVERSVALFKVWKNVPAPVRGELVRKFGDVLRAHKEYLAKHIVTDVRKTIHEARGEIQEAIDMCDFAVGLSRQLYGLTMPSERAGHRIQEQWLPLGPVAVITAFNFPAAVWAWNFCLAAVCGNTVIWKPSEHAPNVAREMHACWALACVTSGKSEFIDVSQICADISVAAAQDLARDPRIPLVSATGSTIMGKSLGPMIAQRLGRSILELGGNNAAIISESCDFDQAVKASVFSAVGTAGQRCTTLRRAFVHRSILTKYLDAMVAAYATIKVGDPADESVLVGPLISKEAADIAQDAVEFAEAQDGVVWTSYDLAEPPFFTPTIIAASEQTPVMYHETFAPILYVVPYDEFSEAIEMVNAVPQGLSASIFSKNIIEIETFMRESYTGLANVNTGTSGAEIGGAFGGEKDTGGGRESGSDAWKSYMRRVTSTINFSGTTALAQGVQFS